MNAPSNWRLWFNRRGRLKGIAIVFVASDYGLELQPNGLIEADRIDYCKRLCDTLNKAEGRPLAYPDRMNTLEQEADA